MSAPSRSEQLFLAKRLLINLTEEAPSPVVPFIQTAPLDYQPVQPVLHPVFETPPKNDYSTVVASINGRIWLQLPLAWLPDLVVFHYFDHWRTQRNNNRVVTASLPSTTPTPGPERIHTRRTQSLQDTVNHLRNLNLDPGDLLASLLRSKTARPFVKEYCTEQARVLLLTTFLVGWDQGDMLANAGDDWYQALELMRLYLETEVSSLDPHPFSLPPTPPDTIKQTVDRLKVRLKITP